MTGGHAHGRPGATGEAPLIGKRVSWNLAARWLADCTGPNNTYADVILWFYYDIATEDFKDGRSSSSLLV